MSTHKLLIQRGSLGIQILPNLLTKFSYCHHFRSPFKKAWWKYSRNFHSSLTRHTLDWLNVARNIRGLQSDVHREKRISDRVYFLYQYYFMDVWKVIEEMSLTIYWNGVNFSSSVDEMVHFVSGHVWEKEVKPCGNGTDWKQIRPLKRFFPPYNQWEKKLFSSALYSRCYEKREWEMRNECCEKFPRKYWFSRFIMTLIVY